MEKKLIEKNMFISGVKQSQLESGRVNSENFQNSKGNSSDSMDNFVGKVTKFFLDIFYAKNHNF